MRPDLSAKYDRLMRQRDDLIVDGVDPAALETPIRPCGATRQPIMDAGWECTGSGLVVVMTPRFGGVELPLVLPARALEIVDPEPWWELPVRPFEGGDHLHFVVPRYPPSAVGDTPLRVGDAVAVFKKIGVTVAGGSLWIGEPNA